MYLTNTNKYTTWKCMVVICSKWNVEGNLINRIVGNFIYWVRRFSYTPDIAYRFLYVFLTMLFLCGFQK